MVRSDSRRRVRCRGPGPRPGADSWGSPCGDRSVFDREVDVIIRDPFPNPPPSRLEPPLDRGAVIYNHLVVDSLSVTLSAVADPTRPASLKRLVEGAAAVTQLT